MVREVVAAFMENPRRLLNDFRRWMSISDPQKLREALASYPTPGPATQPDSKRLYAAFDQLYSGAPDVKHAKGIVFEAIVLELLCKRYTQVDDVCEDNVTVGVDGSTLSTDWTSATVDAAAWSKSLHEGDFYECKTNVNLLKLDDLKPVDQARRIFLRSNDPASPPPNPPLDARAVVGTIFPLWGVNALLNKPVAQGGKKEYIDPYPDVDFLNLSDIVTRTFR